VSPFLACMIPLSNCGVAQSFVTTSPSSANVNLTIGAGQLHALIVPNAPAKSPTFNLTRCTWHRPRVSVLLRVRCHFPACHHSQLKYNRRGLSRSFRHQRLCTMSVCGKTCAAPCCGSNQASATVSVRTSTSPEVRDRTAHSLGYQPDGARDVPAGPLTYPSSARWRSHYGCLPSPTSCRLLDEPTAVMSHAEPSARRLASGA